jgi:enamine deaminase RidA (YjgF/YER057c/UK114 family)
MKQAAMFAAAAAAIALSATSASAEVTRHPGAATSPILAGVTLSPNTTLVILSGQVPSPLNTTGAPDAVETYGDTKTQAISAFKKIDALLAQQGLGLKDVVKLTVFLAGDAKLGGKLDFKGFSEAYAQFFGTPQQSNKAARSVVQVVALANPGFLVEIEATAAK